MTIPRQPEDNHLNTSRLRFHYLDWNSRKEGPLVLLHGIGDNAHIWDHFARGASEFLRVDRTGSERPRPE